jgi:hypothetical protein
MKATVNVWRGLVQESAGLGAIDRAGWATSLEFLRGLPDQGIRADLTVEELLDESLLP